MRSILPALVLFLTLGTSRSVAEEILRVEGKLNKEGVKDRLRVRSRNHEVRFRAGETYHILLECKTMYAFLQLADPDRKEPVRPSGLWARQMAFACPRTTVYRITASAVQHGPDLPYSVRVFQQTASAQGRITSADEKDPKTKNVPFHSHGVRLKEGITYIFQVETNRGVGFRLEDAAGKELARSNSTYFPLLIFRSPTTSAGRLVVTDANQGKAPVPYKLIFGEALSHFEDRLTRDDPPHWYELNKLCKVNEISLEAGKEYEIRMDSKEIDSYLRLEDTEGRILAQDDDSGGLLNARILFRPGKNGKYRIVATTFMPQPTLKEGRYTLTVRTRE